MTLGEATAFIPAVVASLVGFVELRSDIKRSDKVRNLVPVMIALALVVVFFLLERVIDITSPYMPWLARGMTVLAAIVAISGVLIKYSRKANAILIALVGLMLAFYWAFLSMPKP
jgi:uncharacterized membrane protein